MVLKPARQASFQLNVIAQFLAGSPNHASRLHPIVKARLPVALALLALGVSGPGCTTLKHTAVKQLGDALAAGDLGVKFCMALALLPPYRVLVNRLSAASAA